ncbi:hypothetical protein QBC38DRAFT_457890 [Podospora fimiseda]|uniref:Infection structure specific protein n=1 Tax=Podospora fimiseda TaxID=252190 RepID=A0AAN7BK69_9PEZI|nr:hypothetical protein QBC38DRAFT_457890 [Podospora fimiseda]
MFLKTSSIVAVASLVAVVSAQSATQKLNAEECTSAYYSLYAQAPPTAPAALDAWAEKERSKVSKTWSTTYTRDDPGLVVTAFCSDLVALPKPTPPASVEEDWKSYSSALSKWRDDLAPAASSIATACFEAESYVAENVLLMIATDYEGCTKALYVGKRGLVETTSTPIEVPTPSPTAPGGGAKQNDNRVNANPSTATSTGGGVAFAREIRSCAVAAVAAMAVGVAGAMGAF